MLSHIAINYFLNHVHFFIINQYIFSSIPQFTEPYFDQIALLQVHTCLQHHTVVKSALPTLGIRVNVVISMAIFAHTTPELVDDRKPYAIKSPSFWISSIHQWSRLPTFELGFEWE